MTWQVVSHIILPLVMMAVWIGTFRRSHDPWAALGLAFALCWLLIYCVSCSPVSSPREQQNPIPRSFDVLHENCARLSASCTMNNTYSGPVREPQGSFSYSPSDFEMKMQEDQMNELKKH